MSLRLASDSARRSQGESAPPTRHRSRAGWPRPCCVGRPNLPSNPAVRRQLRRRRERNPSSARRQRPMRGPAPLSKPTKQSRPSVRPSESALPAAEAARRQHPAAAVADAQAEACVRSGPSLLRPRSSSLSGRGDGTPPQRSTTATPSYGRSVIGKLFSSSTVAISLSSYTSMAHVPGTRCLD